MPDDFQETVRKEPAGGDGGRSRQRPKKRAQAPLMSLTEVRKVLRSIVEVEPVASSDIARTLDNEGVAYLTMKDDDEIYAVALDPAEFEKLVKQTQRR